MTPTSPQTLPQNNEGYENLVKINMDGLNTLSLLVGGVHCAVCIQKIESSILKLPLIKEARLNFSTGRFNIIWEGSAALANQFVKIITSLGYSVNPYNSDIEKNNS
jgi:Cu2+-exporting ATPase